MKAQIHPKWYPEAKIACACGNSFTTGSTQPEIRVEVCSACHPFYTGQMRYVDTAGRVDQFREKQQRAQTRPKVSKRQRREEKRRKRMEEELARPETLEELRGK